MLKTFYLIVKVIIIISSLIENSFGKKIGEPCSGSDLCEEGFCNASGLCQCLTFPGQSFDPILQKCVNLIGEDCRHEEDCIPNAICIPEWNSVLGKFQGRCRCGVKYFENKDNNTCDHRAMHGETCNEISKPCQFASFVQCEKTTSICTCTNQTSQIFEPNGRETCVYKAGHNCYTQRGRNDAFNCVNNAKCNYSIPISMKNPPICTCTEGFIQTPEGFCYGGYGKSCNSSNPCAYSAGLVCLDGRCQCDSPLHQVFDEGSRKCSTIVNSKCADSNQCVTNAICSNETKTCGCLDGYTRTFTNICKLDIGALCTEDAPRLVAGALGAVGHLGKGESSRYIGLCNSDAGLACKGGKCQCFDSSLVYDEKRKFCGNGERRGACGVIEHRKMAHRITVGCSGENRVCGKNPLADGSKCMCLDGAKMKNSSDLKSVWGIGRFERCLNYEMIL